MPDDVVDEGRRTVDNARRELVRESLFWERLGRSGPPMIFLHPNPTDHRVWIYQMARFSTWFRTIGIDLPGYGRSPSWAPGFTMADVAAACWRAVDETSDEPAVLVGCSVGYAAALHMASLRPGRVSAMIFSGASYRPVKASAPKRIAQYEAEGLAFRRQHFAEVLGSTFRASPLAAYFADLFLEQNQSCDLPTIIELYKAVGAPDEPWLFDTVRAPTLIITGSEDGAHQGAFALRDRIPRASLVTLDGAGHACQLEQPWAWDAHALAFLGDCGLLPAVETS